MTRPTASVEVERKYDVGPGTALPDLAVVEGLVVRAPERFALDATYFDTDDLALRRARTTLRRRSGGHDAGWHLKRPAGQDRLELHLPLADDVPEPLEQLVQVHVHGRALVAVAHLATDRTLHVLCDATGTPLAEVADDRVRGRRLPDGPLVEWREWEVELRDGERGVLDVVEQVLLRAGARASTTGSKVGRVLGV